MKLLFENIIRFVILVLLQALLLNNIQLFNLCNPYIYILFILSLPVNCPRWFDLILGFSLGLCMDIFTNTLGIHAFACTLMAYTRFYAIKLFVSEEDRINDTPSVQSFGVAPYIKYVVMLTLIHHTALFMLESFTFTQWWLTLARILISSLVSIGLILGVETIKK